MTDPSLAEFTALAQRYTVVPVWRDLLADTETPIAVFRRVGGDTGSVLLESVEPGERWGRFSFIGLDPRTTLLSRAGEVTWTDGPICPVPEAGLAATLRAVLSTLRAPDLPGMPPFYAGAVGAIGDRAFDPPPAGPRPAGTRSAGPRPVEPDPAAAAGRAGRADPGDRAQAGPAAGDAADAGADPFAALDAALVFPRLMVVFDHFRQRMRLVTTALIDRAVPVREHYTDAVARLDALMARLAGGWDPGPAPQPTDVADVRMHSDVPDDAYRKMIAMARDRVRAGQARQVGVSRRYTASAPMDALAVYRAMRIANPSPYMYLLRLPGVAVAGSSPQSLVTVRDGRISAPVIAGTRPRGGDADTDARLAADLASEDKERDEHAMLVDLALADLARVARPGSIRVTEREKVVRYSRVMHLVTETASELADGRDVLDVLAALFPAGTVCGTPREAAVRIVRELEPVGRGLYGGAVGYLDFCGNLDMCLGIRALRLRDGVACGQAGAGVVAGSDPDLEVAESRNKAAALFVALRLAAALDTPAAAP